MNGAPGSVNGGAFRRWTRYGPPMPRLLLLSLLCLVLSPTLAQARAPAWEACRAAPAPSPSALSPPVLRDCRPVRGVIDPQGRELWLRAAVQRPMETEPAALYVVGTASSEVWLNDRRLGANGRPGASRAAEIPGRYEAAFPIPDMVWRPADNIAVVRLSAFHGPVRLDAPVAGLLVASYPWPSRAAPLAVVFVIAGALFAAAFGFGLIHSLRRTGSSLTLAALAAVAGLQAILESLRSLLPYAYPVHGWRLIGIWGLTAVFALLLVSWTVSRFWPRGRRPLMLLTVAAIALSSLAPGFDFKTGLALMGGLVLAAVTVGMGVRRRLPAARLTLGWLGLFIAVGLIFPAWLIDLSYFLFAAAFLLPLLMAEVVRLGRDDRRRETVLARAVARSDCLAVASSRGIEQVALADIIAVLGADDYVELRLTDGRSLLHAARLDRLEADLPSSFRRIHRSVLANLNHAKGYERAGGGLRLLMQTGASLPISRNRAAAVKAALTGGAPEA